ncbi:gamma-glutamyl-gamma-aminobutyrate hydrolase family protein [Candidatus Poriferisodalis sp.]|uniref:gamma-glutamyl-gamma-aminobutyrate hydrolase family protein n=1 Tax=Candidatus Poriferisodalis sp. TaxID=3101277 RepID=UPI003B015BB4
MAKPLIGVVGRRRKGSRIDGFPPVFAEIDVDLYVCAYGRDVAAAGAVPVFLPLDADPGEIAQRLDGLLLTGGEDVASCLYADRLDPGSVDPSAGIAPNAFDTPADAVTTGEEIPLRDAFEMAMLDASIAADLPVLGICRGAQVLTVAAGGTLHPDLPSHARTDAPADATTHIVTTAPGSVLRRLYGPELAVNSLHHQAADQLGEGYIATAHSPDGIIEGMEHTELPIIAVQWHPELMTGARSDPCFGWLVEHASR